MKALSTFAVIVGIAISTGVAQSQSPLNQENFREYQRLLAPPAAPPPLKLQTLSAGAPKTIVDPADDCAFSAQSLQTVVESPRQLPCKARNAVERFFVWNQIALETTAIDHVPPPENASEDDRRKRLLQPGPHRSSRAMAIVHVAMFEAVNAVQPRRFSSLTGLASVTAPTSANVAVATAAHRSLVALFPGQKPELDALLAADLANVFDSDSEQAAGKTLGESAAATILALREADGSKHEEPQVGLGYPATSEAGKWQPDPIGGLTVALGAHWHGVKPFALVKADQFRPSPPPTLTDETYSRAFKEVKRLGGDGVKSATERRDFETFQGIFWAYDGTPALCAPPRLYNQVVRTVLLDRAEKHRPKPISVEELGVQDVARLFALVNLGMADAAISAWEAKYHYRFWRPVTGIRAAATDSNSETQPDLLWTPLGAPASNAPGPNFTPPFPAYPSGHAVFGGTIFQVMRKYWKDNTQFVFRSDEFNGSNRDPLSAEPRPDLPQAFVSFGHPEYDNARSRIYLGIHWQFDADAGIAQGNQIADFVYKRVFACLDPKPDACKPAWADKN
jgi:membrane-associated phospholipid phosphatase